MELPLHELVQKGKINGTEKNNSFWKERNVDATYLLQNDILFIPFGTVNLIK